MLSGNVFCNVSGNVTVVLYSWFIGGSGSF